MSGNTYCACRDCMDTTVSSDTTQPELCELCDDAGCEIHYDTDDCGTECQRDDAYSSDQCDGCGWETRNCACAPGDAGTGHGAYEYRSGA